MRKGRAPADANGAQGHASSRGEVLGTPLYMAPEQERGEKVEKTADVYSLGVVLAEMATGQRPSADKKVAAGSTLRQWPELKRLPAALAHFIGGCTDVLPEKRPRDGRAGPGEFVRWAPPANAWKTREKRARPGAQPAWVGGG